MSAMLITRKTKIYTGWTFLLSTKKPANNPCKNSMPAKLSDVLFRLFGEVAVFTVSESFHTLPILKLGAFAVLFTNFTAMLD